MSMAERLPPSGEEARAPYLILAGRGTRGEGLRVPRANDYPRSEIFARPGPIEGPFCLGSSACASRCSRKLGTPRATAS